MQDEEHEVFPKMQQKAGDELSGMGQELAARKQELLAQVQGQSAGRGSDEDLLDLTKEELYERAKEADIPGRSNMSKQELAQALQQAG